MILFGFEVDTLEIALREQLNFVDKVFIVESTLTHKGVRFLVLSGGNDNLCSSVFAVKVFLELKSLSTLSHYTKSSILCQTVRA